MRFLLLIVTALGSVALSVRAQVAGDVAIRSLEPTVLFPKKEPLAQIARLSGENRGTAALDVSVRVAVTGASVLPAQKVALPPGRFTVDVLIPDLAAPADVKVDVISGDTIVAAHTQLWQPQRKWKVHVVKSSHEDIGYEHFIQIKQKEIADFIDLAREIARPRVIDGSGAKTNVGYHYVMETLLFARNYIDERGERAWRKVLKDNVTGGTGLSLMAAPSGVHTHWMDYEQIARVGISCPSRDEGPLRPRSQNRLYRRQSEPLLVGHAGIRRLGY